MSNTPENPEFGNTRHDYNPDDPLNPLNEPPVTDDDTADLTPQDITDSDIDLQRVNLDDDVPFNLPTMDDSDDAHTSDLRDERYGALTQPHFREPGVPDPKATLAGTGGLDPQPGNAAGTATRESDIFAGYPATDSNGARQRR